MPRKKTKTDEPQTAREAIERLMITVANNAEARARRGDIDPQEFVAIMRASQAMFGELRAAEDNAGIGSNINAVATALSDGTVNRGTRLVRAAAGHPKKGTVPGYKSEGSAAKPGGAADPAGRGAAAEDGPLDPDPVASAGAALAPPPGAHRLNGPVLGNPNESGGDDSEDDSGGGG